ncbi:MAG: preprotein translocase subunit YajC [Clostridiales bacterium]|nr:preprotein translocase subunit YajC [Clostridiales bacterium]
MPNETLQQIGSIALPIGLIIVFFLIMILPQRKRDKKMKEMLNNLRNGDKIKTIGGIYGVIVKRTEETLTIELIPSKTRMMISRGAVASLVSKGDEIDEEDADETPEDKQIEE